jgi:hypothetical protein
LLECGDHQLTRCERDRRDVGPGHGNVVGVLVSGGHLEPSPPEESRRRAGHGQRAGRRRVGVGACLHVHPHAGGRRRDRLGERPRAVGTAVGVRGAVAPAGRISPDVAFGEGHVIDSTKR